MSLYERKRRECNKQQMENYMQINPKKDLPTEEQKLEKSLNDMALNIQRISDVFAIIE